MNGIVLSVKINDSGIKKSRDHIDFLTIPRKKFSMNQAQNTFEYIKDKNFLRQISPNHKESLLFRREYGIMKNTDFFRRSGPMMDNREDAPRFRGKVIPEGQYGCTAGGSRR